MVIPTHTLLDVLTRFAETLTDEFDVADVADVADVLYELADSTVAVIGATAAGVSLTDDCGALQFVSANTEPAAELERVQQDSDEGPCHHAFLTGVSVVVNDIVEHAEWPTYRRTAEQQNFRAVLGIPMIVGDRTLGALKVYNADPRSWSPDDVRAAEVLAKIATSYVLHSSRLVASARLNEQLQKALDSRVVIEQAKGLLAGELRISLDEAFDRLRQHARRNQATMRTVAQAVVELDLRPNAIVMSPSSASPN